MVAAALSSLSLTTPTGSRAACKQLRKPASSLAAPRRSLAAAPRAAACEQRAFLVPLAATLSPSWASMSQLMNSLERDMELLSRQAGVPSLRPGWASADLNTSALMAVDVKDTGSAIEIQADVPGIPREAIRVEVSPDRRLLTISGERRSERRQGGAPAAAAEAATQQEGAEETKAEAKAEAEAPAAPTPLVVERSYGSFVRRFRLPEHIDAEGIQASLKDGVLHLSIPKAALPQPQAIQIQVGGPEPAEQPVSAAADGEAAAGAEQAPADEPEGAKGEASQE